MKKAFVFLLIIFAVTFVATPLYATTDGLHSTEMTVRVNDRDFNLWGYICARRASALRLQDMAYMLNGTPAQFALRTPPDDRWDYWIILGEPHTPTGTEFRPIPEERHAWAGDGMGYGGWGGFEDYPIRPIVIGVGGVYEPETSVALTAIRDVDYAHFSMHDLSQLLGFYLVYNRHYHWWGEDWPYHNVVIDTTRGMPAVLPMQEPELARILARLSYRDPGHWVDVKHMYAEEITEAVVWPAEFRISASGFSGVGLETVAPTVTDRWDWQEIERNRLRIYPMQMRTLENGYIELTVIQPEIPTMPWNAQPTYDHEFDILPSRFYNYRIVVDPDQDPILEVTLYIGDARHIMYSHRFAMHFAGRSQAVPAYGGGITLRYVSSRWTWSGMADAEIMVYRSYQHGEERILLHSQQGITDADQLLFEFTDPTAEWGRVYHYMIYAGAQQIFSKYVDARLVLDEPYVPYEPYVPDEPHVPYEPPYVPDEVYETIAEYETEASLSRLWWLAVIPVVVLGLVLFKKLRKED